MLEYIRNYRETTDSLWNYYRDEPSNALSSNSEYKTNIAGTTYNVNPTIVGDDSIQIPSRDYDPGKGGKNETEVGIPLKHLRNFWRTLNMSLFNSEIQLILTWSKNCVLSDMTAVYNPPTRLEFQIRDTKLYVPAVTCRQKMWRNL